MPDTELQSAPLSGVRVVDLTDAQASFSSRLLADLGAEVVKIEPPEGSRERFQGPFLNGIENRENSLSFWYNNGGKLSVTLDLTAENDRQGFLGLISTSDILIEAHPPAYLSRLGLDYTALKQLNPALCVVTVSGFGLEGPYSHYRSCDIVACASGGSMYVCGRPGRQPLKPYGNQSYYLASLFAAIGALLALREKERSGRGQHVEISLQETVAATLEHVLVQYFFDGMVPRRQGSLQWNYSSEIFPCRDKFILLTFGRDWDMLVSLLEQEKMAADLGHQAWQNDSFRAKHIDNIEEVLTLWTCRHSGDDLFKLGQSLRLPWAVVNDVNDVLENEQLNSRGFFIVGKHPLVEKEFRLAGPVLKPCGCESVAWQRSPLLGEHNGRLEKMLAKKDVASETWSEKQTGRALPLDGVRVLDFTWMLAGPYATRILADFGAEVIKVQSRIISSGAESNANGYFAMWNRNKLGITLDMTRRVARELALDLVAKSDVVMENFSPRVMDNWGLGYEKLKQVRPDLVMVSLSGFGRSGPWRDHVALGPTLQSLSGLTYLTAYDKGIADGIGYAYVDHLSGLYAALAVLSGLRCRKNTGAGAYFDISEYEVACSVLGVEFLDLVLNGHAALPQGNKPIYTAAAPHGCYRCRGEDRWCVIAVFTEEEWQSLCSVMCKPELAFDPRFSSLQARLKHSDELDAVIEGWTSSLPPERVMKTLQEAGVPAAVVNDARDLADDPNLKERGFFVDIVHPVLGRIQTDASPIRLDLTPARYIKPAPLLGEDNRYVFIDILGIDEDTYEKYVKEGIIA